MRVLTTPLSMYAFTLRTPLPLPSPRYSGKVVVDGGTVRQLFFVASLLEVQEIQGACANYLVGGSVGEGGGQLTSTVHNTNHF